ncbi:MAG: hypothetical protein ABR955_09155 [Verrucomicrobiota bacterium]|jgi:hypothetical protein
MIASDRYSGWLLNGGIFDDTAWNVEKGHKTLLHALNGLRPLA